MTLQTTSSVGTTRRRSTEEESVTADGIANRKRRSTFVDVDSGQLGLVVSRDSTVGKSEGVDPPLVPLVPPYSLGRNDMESPQLTLSARRRSAATEKRTTAILASNSTPSPPLGGGLVLPPTIPTISKQRRSSITGASGSSRRGASGATGMSLQ